MPRSVLPQSHAGLPAHTAPDAAAPLVVRAADAGQKLVQYLARILGKEPPGSVLMRWIRTGQVRVDGKRAKPFDRLTEGQAVRLPPFALQQFLPGPVDAPADQEPGEILNRLSACGLEAISVTTRWIALRKPAGLPVHPGSGWTDSIQTRLEQAFAGHTFAPAICHRLDRDTTGLLLAARTHQALREAHEAFRQGAVEKYYLCWVCGRWNLGGPGQAIECEDTLAKSGPPGHQKMNRTDQGKLARLAATPLLVAPDRTLVSVRLLSGRTHQIRVQMAERGHPIIGDVKYGGGKGPLYLHSWKLSLPDVRFACAPQWEGVWRIPEEWETDGLAL